MSETAANQDGTLQRQTIFAIVCGGHFINHFQSAMLGVIYPLMMKEVGMSYLAITSLASVYNALGSILQASYGFIVPYFGRGVILGIGNCVLGLSVFANGFASTFSHFFTARLIGGIGSSPQIPSGRACSRATLERYYFIGFVSIPFWTVITGGVMTQYGFGPAFSVISISYLLAMSLLMLLRMPRKAGASALP